MAVIRIWCFALATAALLAACSNMAATSRGSSWASVDPLRDCQDKPFFDTVSASDRRTVIKGMTAQEREVCMELRSGHGLGGTMQ
jgi:hypothetical protein